MRARGGNTHTIGIDEAGRGPLAGPVVVGGIRASRADAAALRRRGIRDSKQLTAWQREQWFEFLTRHPRIAWAAARVSPAVIDRINIRQAALLGARRVHHILRGILRADGGRALPSPSDRTEMVVRVFLDGGLVLPSGIPQQTIVKGDEKIPVIAAASIIAKVTRDRIMRRLHKKYPQYRFDLHKGYGTALHRAMVKKYGRCDIHRKSFRCA